MAKLTLNPAPTFSAEVQIPVPGKDSIAVSFTFKHRTRDELDEFLKRAVDLRDAGLIMEVATGWELADAFTVENVTTLVQNYMASPAVVFDKYLTELTKARAKN